MVRAVCEAKENSMLNHGGQCLQIDQIRNYEAFNQNQGFAVLTLVLLLSLKTY